MAKSNQLDLILHPKFEQFLNPHRYKIAYGGRGCIHPDTFIDTPAGKVKIKDFKGGSVIAMLPSGGVVDALALPPTKYTAEPMFTVSLSNGESITTTAKHRWLTNRGWVCTGDIGAYSTLLLPDVYSLGLQDLYSFSCPSTHGAGVQRLIQTLLSWLYSCLMGFRQCGVLPPIESSTYQDELQQLADAPEHIHHTLICSGGGRCAAGAPFDSHSCLYKRHLSSLCGLLDGGAKNFAERESCNGDIFFEQLLLFFQSVQLSHDCRSLPMLACRLSVLLLDYARGTGQARTRQIISSILLSSIDDETLSSSMVAEGDYLHVTVVDTEPQPPSEFYDLFVPFLNNYSAGGVIHHNSGKSWTVATLLILKAYEQPVRVLCAREIQRSIMDSCLQLLSDTIYRLGLESFFEIQTQQILGKNGSRFIFEGLKANISKIKSMEGIDVVWAEEADQVSATSWNTLIPTIRKPGSQIWVTFNPNDELDDTYQRFVTNPPEDCYSVRVNWSDNPWFPPELEKERLAMKALNDTLYQHIWEGEPVANREGSYYAKYINQDQVVNFPVEPHLPVNSAWDLGMADSTAIWLWQQIGQEIRIVHCYENQGEGLQHYINYLHGWRDKHCCVFGSHYAPHDIAVRELGTGKSRLETARAMGIHFQVAPNVSIEDGIQAVRSMLPKVWFNKDGCADGLRALRSYRKEFDEKRGTYKPRPLHDWSSHYSDAARYMSLSLREHSKAWSAPVTAGNWSVF